MMTPEQIFHAFLLFPLAALITALAWIIANVFEEDKHD